MQGDSKTLYINLQHIYCPPFIRVVYFTVCNTIIVIIKFKFCNILSIKIYFLCYPLAIKHLGESVNSSAPLVNNLCDAKHFYVRLMSDPMPVSDCLM